MEAAVGSWEVVGTGDFNGDGWLDALVLSEPHLTQTELDGIVQAAIARWEASGLTAAQTAILHNVSTPSRGLQTICPTQIAIEQLQEAALGQAA